MEDILNRFEKEIRPQVSDREDILTIFAVGINDTQRNIETGDMITSLSTFEKQFQQ